MARSLSRRQLQVWVVAFIFVGFLIIDQAVKIWVKTHMYVHESIHITDWFYITFIENNGMAFGMELFNKLFLTTFRLLATTAVAVYIAKLIRKGVSCIHNDRCCW